MSQSRNSGAEDELFALSFNPIDVPAGKVLAVFRRGNNYLKSLPPGIAWPVTDFNPLTDMGRYIDTLPRVHRWTFTEVKSREGVPLDFVVTVEYGFDPSGLTRDKATDAISRGEAEREKIVRAEVETALREVAGRSGYREMLNPPAANVGSEIYIRIYGYLGDRGLRVTGPRGVRIEHVAFTPGASEASAEKQARRPAYVRPPEKPSLNVLPDEGKLPEPERPLPPSRRQPSISFEDHERLPAGDVRRSDIEIEDEVVDELVDEATESTPPPTTPEPVQPQYPGPTVRDWPQDADATVDEPPTAAREDDETRPAPDPTARDWRDFDEEEDKV
ncbi:MAG: hypothetical protein Kow00120_25600 [Anaerolineae bacterium]